MKAMRILVFIAFATVFVGGAALAGTRTNKPDAKTTKSPVASAENADEKKWAFSISATTYVVPDDRDYVQPTITADRGWLHLEARYNYENLDTGSAWVGINFSGGKKLEWEFTPMVGGVFGETKGIAPGYKGSLSWWKLEFYSEGEYVFDSENSEDSFFYNWSELTLAPVDWLQVGMATQRTRAYQSERDIQRGVLVRLLFKKLNVTGYVMNPDQSKPTFMVTVGLDF
jgi:hypothetical protein